MPFAVITIRIRQLVLSPTAGHSVNGGDVAGGGAHAAAAPTSEAATASAATTRLLVPRCLLRIWTSSRSVLGADILSAAAGGKACSTASGHSHRVKAVSTGPKSVARRRAGTPVSRQV